MYDMLCLSTTDSYIKRWKSHVKTSRKNILQKAIVSPNLIKNVPTGNWKHQHVICTYSRFRKDNFHIFKKSY